MQGDCSESTGDVTDWGKVLREEDNLDTQELLGTHSGIFSDRCSICSIRVCRINKNALKIHCFSYSFHYFLIRTHTNARKSVSTENLKHKNVSYNTIR